MITSDHGCDPNSSKMTTSREYTLLYLKTVRQTVIWDEKQFLDIAATVLEILGVSGKTDGMDFIMR